MNPLEEIDPTANRAEEGEYTRNTFKRRLNIEAFMATVEGDLDLLYKYLTSPLLKGIKMRKGRAEKFIKEEYGEGKYWREYVQSRRDFWNSYLENRKKGENIEKPLVIEEKDLDSVILSRETKRRDTPTPGQEEMRKREGLPTRKDMGESTLVLKEGDLELFQEILLAKRKRDQEGGKDDRNGWEYILV